MTSRPTRSRLAGAAFALCAGLALVGLAAPPAHADWVRDDQWQLSALNARTAWDTSTGDGVVVAVLDSGVDADHPDLAGQVLPGADFVDGTTDGRTDFVGHGTTVAGLIAGRADDETGVEGIAPGAKILPVRVLDRENKYDDAGVVANGLRWAVDHGASVVNMSLGGTIRSEALAAAIGYAYAHDVVVVACTGNSAAGTPSGVWYPAREPGVVAVAGLSAGEGTTALWSGAQTGPQTVLAAPAVNLIGAKPGGYWRVQGTSFAAPLVAATAALIRARWRTMDAANVVNRLVGTADDLGAAGRDARYGYGEVDPVNALTATGIRPVTKNPLLPPAATAGPQPGSPGVARGAGGLVPAQRPAAAAPQRVPNRGIEWGLAAGAALLGGMACVILTRRRG